MFEPFLLFLNVKLTDHAFLFLFIDNKPSKFIDRALPAPPKQIPDLNESLAENPYEMVSPDREKPSTPYEDLDESLYQDLPDNGNAGPLGVSPNSDYLEPLTGGEVVNKRDSRADLPPPPPPPSSQGGAKPKTSSNQGSGVVEKPQADWRPRVLPRRRPSNRQANRPATGESELSIYANCDAITEREKPALGLHEGFRKIAIMNMECIQHLQSSLASEYVAENPKQKDNLKWKDFNVYTKEPLYSHNGVVLYSAQSKSDFRDCVVMVSSCCLYFMYFLIIIHILFITSYAIFEHQYSHPDFLYIKTAYSTASQTTLENI